MHARIIRVGNIFNLWWVDGANEVMDAVTGRTYQKTAKQLEVMAADEFSTAMEEKDIEVAAVIEATTLLIGNLKATLKLAESTYNLGRDQIHISLTDNSIPAAGLPGKQPQTLVTRGEQGGSTESLRQAFGDRVVTSKPVVDEDDLEQALDPSLRANLNPGNLKVYGQGQGAQQMEQELAHAAQAEPEPETPQASAEHIQVTFSLDEPELPVDPRCQEPVKAAEPPVAQAPAAPLVHKKGSPLLVDFNVNVQAPGLSGKHNNVDIRRGTTRLELTAQTNPAENGIYRFMGADQPLMPMDPKTVPPTAGITLDESKQSSVISMTSNILAQPTEGVGLGDTTPAPAEAPLPWEPDPVKTPEVTTVTMQGADPFSEIKVTAPVHATKQVSLDDDDEDALLAGITSVVNATPASAELPAKVDQSELGPSTALAVSAAAAATPIVYLSEPMPPTPVPGVPAAPPVIPPVTSLFRARSVTAPGVTVIDKPFPSTKPQAAPAAGLDEIL